jgi:single-strand DNA-binding protein
MRNLKNSVQLIGHLGNNVETKKLANDTFLATVNLATNEPKKNDKGEYIDHTSWHRIVGWGKVAERMQKLMKKGLEVAIQGRLLQRSYEDKNGIKRYVTEIHVNDFLLLDKEARKSKKEEVAF